MILIPSAIHMPKIAIFSSNPTQSVETRHLMVCPSSGDEIDGLYIHVHKGVSKAVPYVWLCVKNCAYLEELGYSYKPKKRTMTKQVNSRFKVSYKMEIQNRTSSKVQQKNYPPKPTAFCPTGNPCAFAMPDFGFVADNEKHEQVRNINK